MSLVTASHAWQFVAYELGWGEQACLPELSQTAESIGIIETTDLITSSYIAEAFSYLEVTEKESLETLYKAP